MARSLILTDHYFTQEQLSDFGTEIKRGNEPAINPDFERATVTQVDDLLLEKLALMADPAHREYCRKRERNIILAIMVVLIAGIAWMLYRFAIG